ncbi:MAG: carbon monoxide dehydrogenase subunit G [Planctomycetota bacterium]|jgi:carbon monoxide dehydrogenase subunit G
MNFTGEYQLSASRDDVWQALNNIEVLQDAIPGCQEFTEIAENQYQAIIHTKLGPVTAKFKTKVSVENLVPPQSYTLVIDSSGGAQGMGQGIANVNLVESGEQTNLEYSVEFKVRGKLAQVGSRLISNAIKKLSAQFFDKFAANFDQSGVNA